MVPSSCMCGTGLWVVYQLSNQTGQHWRFRFARVAHHQRTLHQRVLVQLEFRIVHGHTVYSRNKHCMVPYCDYISDDYNVAVIFMMMVAIPILR